ncbi:MAG: DUF4395 domain-containing protein [Propionicimonas sp.]
MTAPVGDVRVRRRFHFPNPVNEWAARSVAGGVFALSVLTLLTGWYWLTAVLFVGFALRLGWGPRYSPLGRFAVHLIAPRLGEPRPVPGPPKRFAQGIGTVVTGLAAVLWFTTGSAIGPVVLLGILVLASGLEAFLGFCLGCWIFAHLMAWGVIPNSVCEECARVSTRYAENPA